MRGRDEALDERSLASGHCCITSRATPGSSGPYEWPRHFSTYGFGGLSSPAFAFPRQSRGGTNFSFGLIKRALALGLCLRHRAIGYRDIGSSPVFAHTL